MKKYVLLSFYLISALAFSNNEIELEQSIITNKNSAYSGSVTQNEKKNIVLVTKSDIEKKNYKDLESIFKDSPVTSVVYTEAGPLVVLRGSGQKTAMRVKVLLDGNSINTVDDSMGVIPFNSIPVSSIEKIEIIPGGGITLYGSGSSSGVINIITNSSKTNNFGNLSLTASSFNTYNVTLTKGIKLGDRVFLNLGMEGQKGKGYRDKDESEKLNLLTGIEFKLNEKNRLRLSGSRFFENADTTDELDLISLSKNRRGAGNSDIDVKSRRYSYSIDYEYKAKPNLTFTTSYNQSKYKRDINQFNRPYLTFLPSEWIEDLYGVPDGYSADLVIKNANNNLKGNIEEEIKNGKFKTDYSYNDGKGNLTFGYDYSDHRLKRFMDIKTEPFDPQEKTFLFLRKQEDRVINEEILKQHPENLMNFYTNVLSMFFMGDGDEYGLDDAKTSKRAMNILYRNTTSEEEKRKYEAGDPYPFGWDTIKNNLWKVVYELSEEDISKYTKNGNNYILDSEGNKVYLKNEKMKDIAKLISPDYFDSTFSMSPITTATVDVKKKNHSFYLFNNYKLTDRLEINAGLRYEKAIYNGERKTRTEQIIRGNADKGSTKSMIDMYTALSDVEYYKREQGQRHNWGGNDTSKEKLKELKEKGYTTIVMSELSRKDKRKEENFGGEIGFNYRFNDTDTVYTKYERAFNTPLPTQLTNKTFDPRTKIKVYWESNLKTEKIDNFELGIRGTINNNITYSLAGFVSDTKNEILSIVKDGSSHMLREWRFINIDRTRRMGLEFQSQQVFDKLTLKQSITYVDPKILSNDYERQVLQIGKDRAEDLYRNLRASDANYSVKYSFWKNGVPEAERDRLADGANKILDNLYEGRITKDESKKQLQDLINTSPYKDKYNNDNYLKNYGLLSDKELKRRAELKKEIYEQFDNEVRRTADGSYLKKGDKIPLSPRLKATLSADYQFTEKLKLGANATYIGRYLTAEPGKGYEIVTTNVPSHWVADVYGTYNITEDFSVKFGLNNIFNHKYYLRQDSRTATPAPGRTWNLGVNYRF